MNTGQACSRSQGQLQGYHIKHTHTQKFSVVTQKKFTVLAAPDLHVFGLNIIQRLNQMFSHFLVLLHIYTSWFCTFYFLCIFPLSVSLYLLYPPPHLVQSSSAACVEECLLFPLSSPSPGASKGGGPTQGVWRAHRHSPMGGELADAQTTHNSI